MLDTLITSKTRLKLLLKFFLNSGARAHLRNLESEFGESTNAIRLELNKFEEAGLLKSEIKGNKKVFRANTGHPLFSDIHNILLKTIGFDQIIDRVVTKLGNVEKAYVTGDFARGIDAPIIDLVLVGDDINQEYLVRLANKTEELIKRKIRYIIFRPEEFEDYRRKISAKDLLLIWRSEG
ncbi:MAG: ArsR family transcriptional regulator [Bacteroidales bacterium]|nr:ArsR family transcriptional regulator [Bacteroidales bacterium]